LGPINDIYFYVGAKSKASAYNWLSIRRCRRASEKSILPNHYLSDRAVSKCYWKLYKKKKSINIFEFSFSNFDWIGAAAAVVQAKKMHKIASSSVSGKINNN
jgi:hypothetical protein